MNSSSKFTINSVRTINKFAENLQRIRPVSISTCNTRASSSYLHHVSDISLQHITIGQLLQRAADKWPNREAVVAREEDKRMTYSQLLVEADKLAASLLNIGLESGDRVGVWSPNCTQWIVSMMAIARAGLIMVPINPYYTTTEIEFSIKKVQMKALICSEEFKGHNYYRSLLELAPELERCKPGELASAKLSGLKTLILISDKTFPGSFNFDQLSKQSQNSSAQNVSFLQSRICPDSGCNIQFTSGTTGDPKAALLSHFSIVNNGYFVGRRNELDQQHHTVCLQVPLFHVFALVAGISGALHHGATLVLPSSAYSPNANARAILAEKCSVIYGTPTMYVDLVGAMETAGAAEGEDSMQIAVSGGAPCSPQLFQRMKDTLRVKSVKSIYGMTETTAVIFQSLPGEKVEQALETVGHLHEHVEAKVVDENGVKVPFGTPGELYVRGYGNMLGYWGDRKKTDDICKADKWLQTGDKFILQENGYGNIVGRLKDMLIRGGENIYPKEIEDFLNTHPNILESQVFGVADERLGEEVCVAIRVREGTQVTEKTVKEFCRSRLANFKVPRLVKVVEVYPKTASGKIQKYKLRQMVESGML